ncbi:MAG: maleylpyruvate isomerase family mycothiol-dependent enzyme [Actinomycetota bacterium]
MATPGRHRLDHAAYCDAVEVEVARFVDVSNGLDPAAPVPTCPDWSAVDLMQHVGTVHRWAGSMVKVLAPKRHGKEQLQLDLPNAASGYPAWLEAGGRLVVEALRKQDPDASMWSWGPDQHVRFWSRRMLHETSVHRADAGFTAGVEPEIARDVAVDGVDEFLENLPSAKFSPRVTELRGAGERIVLRSTDADVAWTITLEAERFAWEHADDGGDVTVEGRASDLVLFVYGRRDPADESRFAVAGDQGILSFWRERSSL